MRERELAGRTASIRSIIGSATETMTNGETAFSGILLERIQHSAEVALTDRRKIAVVSAVQRRHFHQHKAVFEADLRIVMARHTEKRSTKQRSHR